MILHSTAGHYMKMQFLHHESMFQRALSEFLDKQRSFAKPSKLCVFKWKEVSTNLQAISCHCSGPLPGRQLEAQHIVSCYAW